MSPNIFLEPGFDLPAEFRATASKASAVLLCLYVDRDFPYVSSIHATMSSTNMMKLWNLAIALMTNLIYGSGLFHAHFFSNEKHSVSKKHATVPTDKFLRLQCIFGVTGRRLVK